MMMMMLFLLLLCLLLVVVVVIVIVSKSVGTQRNISGVTGCHHAAHLNPSSSNTRIHHW
jgi:hypothetical protein